MKTICWIRWMFLWIQGRDRTLKTGFAKMSRAWSPLKIWRCQSVADASPEEWESEDNSPTCPVIESQNENLDSWPGSLVVCCGRILIWAYTWWLMVTMFRLRFPCHEQMMNRWWTDDEWCVWQELAVPSRPARLPEPPGRFGVLTGGDRLVRQLQVSRIRRFQWICWIHSDLRQIQHIEL